MKYLTFRTREDMIFVDNQEGEQLGYLSYERVGRWMHWCWYQHSGIRMSPGCLEELRIYQKKLAKVRRNMLKPGGKQ